jgi:hypothetical protein
MISHSRPSLPFYMPALHYHRRGTSPMPVAIGTTWRAARGRRRSPAPAARRPRRSPPPGAQLEARGDRRRQGRSAAPGAPARAPRRASTSGTSSRAATASTRRQRHQREAEAGSAAPGAPARGRRPVPHLAACLGRLRAGSACLTRASPSGTSHRRKECVSYKCCLLFGMDGG